MRRLRATLLAALFTAAAALPAAAMTIDPQTLPGNQLVLRNVVGTIHVQTNGQPGQIEVRISGEKEQELRKIEVLREQDNVVIARAPYVKKEGTSWKLEADDVHIDIIMPRQGGVTVEDMIGELKLDDLDGPLNATIKTAADIKTGDLKQADLTVAGAASIKTGAIAGPLAALVSGAADMELHSVGQGAKFTITGFGNVNADRVDGPVDIKVSGVGDVDIHDGNTDMLRVTISGLGGVEFKGKVRDQQINRSGLASVTINGKSVD
ncbi:hypothetical protein [Niveispirillum sp. BGYR6]|uniref:hypothetical protein n=1 Tax=Niveispirillum sp. BGYR6 TaxID=2971249 RepID=UPI0022B9721B|nr:hypothetical protein [Niveispirillum sp. BGYR6]MDG5495209.1 hypothetical protein [Niveispirillum sp. BGYR6]